MLLPFEYITYLQLKENILGSLRRHVSPDVVRESCQKTLAGGVLVYKDGIIKPMNRGAIKAIKQYFSGELPGMYNL